MEVERRSSTSCSSIRDENENEYEYEVERGSERAGVWEVREDEGVGCQGTAR